MEHECTHNPDICSGCLADPAHQEARRLERAGQAQVFAALDIINPPRFLVVGSWDMRMYHTLKAVISFIACELDHVPAVLDRQENAWVTDVVRAVLEDPQKVRAMLGDPHYVI